MLHTNQLLTPKQVAYILNIDLATVYRQCRKGHLPAFKVGRLWRIRPDELERYMQPTTQPLHTHGGPR